MDLTTLTRACVVAAMAALTVACASSDAAHPRGDHVSSRFQHARVTEHRGTDDLLTAGLGLEGLRAFAPPAFADASAPQPAEVRRRAIWANWRGIADLSPGGGYGTLYGSTAAVPGREYSALATVPGARQPHRVLVQVPDGFDRARRCIVVAASSGSRGVYGAISVAGAWGLPKGCAVAYTDKGAGTDYVDLDAGTGVRGDGTLAPLGTDGLAFTAAGGTGVAFKHAHSGDNPEADWGRHVRDAAEYALVALGEAFPDDAPFAFDNTLVIAVGISNGGGAVLRAAEMPGGWLDAVVAGEPNVYVEGDRPLYDVATEAALLMPCALLALDNLPQPPLQAQARPQWTAQCAALREAGLVEGGDADAQARDALARLRAAGWNDGALRAGALSVGFDLWRAVAATYASAYGRYGVGDHPCGLRFATLDGSGAARPSTAAERAAWPSDTSGIPPGAGVALVNAQGRVDADVGTLRCLRGLWTGDGADARRVRAGIAATQVSRPRHGLPVFVIHGTDDGLVPMAFTSTPYVAMARAAGADVRFWQVRNAQHFDGFLGLPDYGARYVPMLPYVYAALDISLAHLELGTRFPGDAELQTTPRGGAPLEARHLAIPEVPLR